VLRLMTDQTPPLSDFARLRTCVVLAFLTARVYLFRFVIREESVDAI